MAGEVHVMFDALLSALPQIQAGKLRALAVTTATRWKGLPDIPTVGEFVPGYTVSGLLGIGAPKDTPAEIIGRLNREINAVIADPGIAAGLAELGSTPLPGSPADYGKLIAEDTEKWGKVIRAANIKAE
jgi:tripartite-type tricarboxylate transporter receptor subunit TctC